MAWKGDFGNSDSHFPVKLRAAAILPISSEYLAPSPFPTTATVTVGETLSIYGCPDLL